MTRDPEQSTIIRTALAVSCAALLLTACAGGLPEGSGPAPLTPTSRYSLQVEPDIERIALAVHDNGLSANQENALADLARRFGAAGAPEMRIEVPGGNDPVATEAAWKIRAALEQMGVPGRLIRIDGYAAPDPRAPVLVGFETARAVVPQCGTRWGSLTRTGSNAGFENFGCAINANLAAQIADPRDIVTPRDMTPSDAGRRSVVFDNYRKGAETSAPQEALISNQRVSESVE